jgi:hypothetical protein
MSKQTRRQAFADRVALETGAEIMDDDYVIGYWARICQLHSLSPIVSGDFDEGVKDAEQDLANDAELGGRR